MKLTVGFIVSCIKETNLAKIDIFYLSFITFHDFKLLPYYYLKPLLIMGEMSGCTFEDPHHHKRKVKYRKVQHGFDFYHF